MSYSVAERAVLDRYHEKCRLAGGVRPGYMLRKAALDHGEAALGLGAALDDLVERGLLVASEGGDLYYLTEEGAEELAALHS